RAPRARSRGPAGAVGRHAELDRDTTPHRKLVVGHAPAPAVVGLGGQEVRLRVVGERGENLVELAVGDAERARDATEAGEMLGLARADEDVVDCVDGPAAVAGESVDPGTDLADRVR